MADHADSGMAEPKGRMRRRVCGSVNCAASWSVEAMSAPGKVCVSWTDEGAAESAPGMPGSNQMTIGEVFWP